MNIQRIKNAVKINLAVYDDESTLIETCQFFNIIPTKSKGGDYKFLNGQLEGLFTVTKEEIEELRKDIKS